jgi:hypothetical protein
MIPGPFPGFMHFTTHHCVTGSMQHIYEFNGFPTVYPFWHIGSNGGMILLLQRCT